MKRILFITVVFVLPSLWVSGCAAPPGLNTPAASDSTGSATPEMVVVQVPTFTPPSSTSPSETLSPQPSATLPLPTSSSTTANTPTAITFGGTLWIRILTPLDNAVVNTDSIWVTGEAPKDTVISINDDILLVDHTQTFEVEISLEEGPNLIEIVASNLQGEEIFIELIVNKE